MYYKRREKKEKTQKFQQNTHYQNQVCSYSHPDSLHQYIGGKTENIKVAKQKIKRYGEEKERENANRITQEEK